MSTLVQSLSWALLQSFVQGMLVYLALSVLLWTIPGGRSRMRYNLSFFALVMLLCGFFISWWREYNLLAAFDVNPVGSLMVSSLPFSWTPAGSAAISSVPGYRFFPLLGTAYIVGITVMVVRLLIGLSHVISLRGRGTSLPAASVTKLFGVLKQRLQIAPTVQLMISVKARVPMVVGVVKPMVLVPAATIAHLDADQLEAILIHELVHIKRLDYLANIVQAAIETVLFFNPFMWLVSSGVRGERERCCDDVVVSMVQEPITYAMALTELASGRSRSGALTLAATGHSNKLLARVQRIVEAGDLRLNYSKVIASIILLAVMAGTVAWVKPAFSHKTKKATVKNVVSKTEEEEPAHEGRKNATVANTPQIAKPVLATPRSPREGAKQQATAMPDESVLVNRLLQAGVVDQVKGFLIERHFKELYINRQMLPADVSAQYLQGLSKDIIRVQVFPMEERMRMHPDADFIQLLLPFTFESPCMDNSAKKEGC